MPPSPAAGQPGLVEPVGQHPRADTRPPPHRLFDLEPDLLPLFQYNCRQFSSPEDCLSSPEFLDHIRKVRGRGSAFLGEKGLGIGRITCDSCPRPGLTPVSAPYPQSPATAAAPAPFRWGIRPFPSVLRWAGSQARGSGFSPTLCSASCSQLCPLPLALSPGSCSWCWL